MMTALLFLLFIGFMIVGVSVTIAIGAVALVVFVLRGGRTKGRTESAYGLDPASLTMRACQPRFRRADT